MLTGRSGFGWVAGMQRFDISMPLYRGMPAFPGDPPFGSERAQSMDRGDPYNLSVLTLGSHVGTHVDPPIYFVREGAAIDRIDLSILNGPCRVVSIPDSAGSVGPRELSSVPKGTARVLLRAANSERWRQTLEFFPDYVALAPDGAEALLERGTRLVGIDSLSIERDPTRRYPVHHRLLGSGALILEGLLLSEVPAGSYELECLPLRLKDGDGGPARAILTSP